MESYLNTVKTEGFSKVSEKFDKTWGDYPFQLQIKRNDNVDIESVDKYVIYLFNIANEFKADYDGWETSIEK